MLRTCPKARGFVLIDYLFATWLMSLLCFFILEAFSLGLWWTRTWEPGLRSKGPASFCRYRSEGSPFGSLSVGGNRANRS